MATGGRHLIKSHKTVMKIELPSRRRHERRRGRVRARALPRVQASAVAGMSAVVGACACARMHDAPPPSPQSSEHAPLDALLALPQTIAASTAPASAAPTWSEQVCEKTRVEQASVRNVKHDHGASARQQTYCSRVRLALANLPMPSCSCRHLLHLQAVSACCVQDGLLHRMRVGSTVPWTQLRRSARSNSQSRSDGRTSREGRHHVAEECHRS